MTLQLMIIHQHTKFGYKRLSGSGDNIWTKSGHTDAQKHGQTDAVIPIYPPNFITGGEGGGDLRFSLQFYKEQMYIVLRI